MPKDDTTAEIDARIESHMETIRRSADLLASQRDNALRDLEREKRHTEKLNRELEMAHIRLEELNALVAKLREDR